MSRFKSEYYNSSSGVVVTLVWGSEEEYNLGSAFLRELAGEPMKPVGRPNAPDFYYLKTKQQATALYAFLRQLKHRRATQK